MNDGELLAAVGEAPNDDGPRIVYADWLLQQPDAAQRARGEYISLACSAVRSPARTARLQALLDAHEEEWLGPVFGLTDRRVWSRGFLEACALGFTWSDTALDHPAWRTLRLLDARGLAVATPDRVRALSQPELARLRTLCIASDFVAPLAETVAAPQIAELAIDMSHPVRSHGPAALLPLLQTAPAYRRVRRLHLTASWTPEITSELARADLAIAVIATPQRLDAWLDALDARRTQLAEVRLVPELYPLLAREGLELVVRIGANGLWSELEVRWTDADQPRRRDDILAALRRLRRGRLTRVTFVGPDRAAFDVARWKTRIRTALADQPGARFG